MFRSLPSSLILDQETQQQMSLAHHMLGRLDEVAARLPDPTVVVGLTRCQEVHSMLALRGATFVAKEIAYLGLPRELNPQGKLGRYVESVDEAVGCVEKTSIGWAFLRVATRFAQLYDSSASGDERRCRTVGEWLANSPGIVHRDRAERLVEWMDKPSDMLLLSRVALGMHLLCRLAPFTHTSDLLHVYVLLELVNAGALRHQIVATSVHIERHGTRFQRIHQRTVETGDFNEWVRFVAEGVIEQCHNQLNFITQLSQLRDRNMAKVRDRRRDGFTRFMGNLASFQVITATLAAARCDITVKYARELLNYAEELGMVVDLGERRRNKVYEVREVRRLVERFAGVVPAKDRTVHDE